MSLHNPTFQLSEEWRHKIWADAYLDPARARFSIFGLPCVADSILGLARLKTQTNLQTSYINVHDDPISPDRMAEALFEQHGAAIVEMAYIAEDARTRDILLAVPRCWAMDEQLAVRVIADCSAEFDQWLDRRSAKARKYFRHVERTMPARVAASFAVHCGVTGLRELLDEIFALEASGWKGELGTAMRNCPRDLRYYTELAQGAAETGTLRLATLRDGGRLVAFELNILDGETLLSHKASYDESYAKLHPGNYLTYRVVEHACASPEIRQIDMLGNSTKNSTAKLRFADRFKSVRRVRLIRKSALGLAVLLGYRLRARLKRARFVENT